MKDSIFLHGFFRFIVGFLVPLLMAYVTLALLIAGIAVVFGDVLFPAWAGVLIVLIHSAIVSWLFRWLLLWLLEIKYYKNPRIYLWGRPY